MLRQSIGDESFWKGMRSFYERFRNSNALTSDFEKVMEEVSGKNLEKFFHQWLYVAGQPDLKITKQTGNKSGFIDIFIEQQQNNTFTFNLEISVKDSAGTRIEKVAVSDKITRLSVKGNPDSEIVPDPDIKLLFRTVQN
jgi:aminopeptidase N